MSEVPGARNELAEEIISTKDGEFPRTYVEHRYASGLPLVERSNEEIYDLLREVNERLKRMDG